jgi:exosortase B
VVISVSRRTRIITVRSSLTAAALGAYARRNGLLALLFASLIAAYIPTYIKLAAGPWRTEQEGHGPLIILAAIWVAWQCRHALSKIEISPAPLAGWIILLGGLVVMILARALDVLFFEVLSEIPVIAGCLVILGGWHVLRIFLFPLGFLFFSAPPPGWMLDAGTVPLKALVSDWVAQVLYSAGYPIAQNGVMIMIGPYQLLVKDACAGMNSIFALSAIGIFYVYAVSHGSKIHNFILLFSILPITIAANFVRVLALVLLAYYGGIDAVEGVYHEVTGVALFVVAVLLLFLLDAFLSAIESLWRKFRGPPSAPFRTTAGE